jgi:hypothetical protein
MVEKFPDNLLVSVFAGMMKRSISVLIFLIQIRPQRQPLVQIPHGAGFAGFVDGDGCLLPASGWINGVADLQ